MIDTPTVLLAYLRSKTALTALTGTRIWAELVMPRKGYTPSQGAAICFRTRGGQLDYSSAVIRQSWQFKCYAADELAANTLYRTLVDVLDSQAKTGIIQSALLESTGQTLHETELEMSGWAYVLCYFETLMLAQAA